MKYVIFIICFSFVACNNVQNQTTQSKQSNKMVNNDGTTTIYLVRHAEKDTGKNPPLTTVGEQRAEDLAAFLKDKGITEIFSTDYIRTQKTAAPTAKQASRGVGSYNPSNLSDFAKKIRKTSGTILIVGHSDTTPKLVEILGGNPGEPIVEEWEYDRIYELKLQKGEVVFSEILRYGKKSN